MGATKELFTLMREQEMQTNNFLPTKKELVKSSVQFVREIVESGEYDITELYSQAIRAKEALNAIEAELRKNIGDQSFEAFGIKATYRNGGETINYKDDEVVLSLEKKLSDRKESLKLALKSDSELYDSDGVLVPKVSTTPRKSGLSISF